jgi:hypothetical protein
MTVAELIAILQTMPQNVQVMVNDNRNGIFHEELDVDYFAAHPKYHEPAMVVLQVNT